MDLHDGVRISLVTAVGRIHNTGLSIMDKASQILSDMWLILLRFVGFLTLSVLEFRCTLRKKNVEQMWSSQIGQRATRSAALLVDL